MKLESLVTAHQLWCGEYVLGLCTQNEMRLAAQRTKRFKSSPASVGGSVAEGQGQYRKVRPEGSDAANDSSTYYGCVDRYGVLSGRHDKRRPVEMPGNVLCVTQGDPYF